MYKIIKIFKYPPSFTIPIAMKIHLISSDRLNKMNLFINVNVYGAVRFFHQYGLFISYCDKCNNRFYLF